MPAVPRDSSFDDIVHQWHDLAERRLADYTELYRSGRWRLYFTQEDFAVRMRDVIKVVKTWRALAASRPGVQRISRGDRLRPAA